MTSFLDLGTCGQTTPGQTKPVCHHLPSHQLHQNSHLCLLLSCLSPSLQEPTKVSFRNVFCRILYTQTPCFQQQREAPPAVAAITFFLLSIAQLDVVESLHVPQRLAKVGEPLFVILILQTELFTAFLEQTKRMGDPQLKYGVSSYLLLEEEPLSQLLLHGQLRVVLSEAPVQEDARLAPRAVLLQQSLLPLRTGGPRE